MYVPAFGSLTRLTNKHHTVLFPPEWLPSHSDHLLRRTPSRRPFVLNPYVASTRIITMTKRTPGLVKAVQNGTVIFVLMCSFHKPEPYQPSHAWPMPPNVPNPEDCELQEIIWAREATKDGMDERTKGIYQIIIEVSDILVLCRT
jgi:hypothetical protein